MPHCSIGQEVYSECKWGIFIYLFFFLLTSLEDFHRGLPCHHPQSSSFHSSRGLAVLSRFLLWVGVFLGPGFWVQCFPGGDTGWWSKGHLETGQSWVTFLSVFKSDLDLGFFLTHTQREAPSLNLKMSFFLGHTTWWPAHNWNIKLGLWCRNVSS